MLYDVPRPTEALLITGGMTSRKNGNPYRVVVGGGAWSIPIFHRVHRFPIGANTVNISVSAQSKQNVDVDVQASVVFSVIPDNVNIIQSANRFLGVGHDQILSTAQDIFSGETRAIIGTMNVEDMISDRLMLASEVLTNAEPRMNRFGWQIDSFQINSISDSRGYINALSAPELARVEREKAVAEAQRDAEIANEREKASRLKSSYERDTAVQIAENEMFIAKSQAEAKNARPLAQAEADKELARKNAELAEIKAESDRLVAEANTKLAEQEAALEEARLLTTVVKPAEADASSKRISAEAEAESIRLVGEALSGSPSVLDKEIIDNLPEIVKSLSEALSSADMTIIGEGQEVGGTLGTIAALAPQIAKQVGLQHDVRGVIDHK